MDGWATAITVLDIAVREAILFAACGFLVGGIDDLAIDLIFFACAGWRRIAVTRSAECAPDFPAGGAPRRIAVFVAAWDEAAVIGQMLTTALTRFDHANYTIFVGVYPNDRLTIAAVAAIAQWDDRIRMVVTPDDGPTTKADCLNAIWRALIRDEQARDERFSAVVFHDAEDVVHPAELRVFAALIENYAAVQLPVMPIVDPRGPLISGHYCDEFAEAHGKQMVVRQALGAGMPLAGVGCAVARNMLGRIADARDGAPFDDTSLTEDYELGLHIGRVGGRCVLARIREYHGGPLVAVRAYFPARIDAAVRQKARWMTGIALAGWDRVGWAPGLDWIEHWMRMRDRRGPLAVLVLGIAYAALLGWGASFALHAAWRQPMVSMSDATQLLLWINGVLLIWRLAMRALFTGREYGAKAAALSLPRAFVGNLISLMAARRALMRYVAMLRGGRLEWEKTAHAFPEQQRADPA